MKVTIIILLIIEFNANNYLSNYKNSLYYFAAASDFLF